MGNHFNWILVGTMLSTKKSKRKKTDKQLPVYHLSEFLLLIVSVIGFLILVKEMII